MSKNYIIMAVLSMVVAGLVAVAQEPFFQGVMCGTLGVIS